MVLLNAPYVVGNAKLLSYIAQILVIRHDAGNVAIELSCLPTGQQVIQAMAHLRNENGHARTLVAIIERELHLIALSIERGDVIVEFVAGNQKTVQFPFYAHKEHAVLFVNILVKVDDVSFIIRYKFSHFRYDALLVRTVKKQNCGWFHFFFQLLIY